MTSRWIWFVPSMQRLAEVGVGASILPEPLVRSAIAAGRLRHVRLGDARFERRLATAMHRGRDLPEAARWFLSLVHRRYPPLPTPRRRAAAESGAGSTGPGEPRERRKTRRARS